MNDLDKWEKTMKLKEDLKALAKIKIILDDLAHKGYHIDYELEDYLSDIEEILDRKDLYKENCHLLYIKRRINKCFELIGREENDKGQAKSIMINDLIKYMEQVEIPKNYLVIQKLKYEREM